jgi:hypothetical protein
MHTLFIVIFVVFVVDLLIFGYYLISNSMYNWNVSGVKSKLLIDVIFVIACLQTVVWAKHVLCSACAPNYRRTTTVV